MRFLNIITGIALAILFSLKGYELITYRDRLDNILDFLSIESSHIATSIKNESEFNLILFWTILLGILLISWIWMNVRKKKKGMPILSALTIICFLGVQITDQLDFSFFSKDKIIGGELIFPD